MYINFKGLLSFLLISQFFNCTLGLFEDQAGKFDWRQQYFGEVRTLLNDPNQPKRILVGTKDNIIGALNANTGAILYRNILEASGELLYYGIYNTKTSVAISEIDSIIKVRLFTIATGIQKEEFVLTKSPNVLQAFESNEKYYLVMRPKPDPTITNDVLTFEVYNSEKLLSTKQIKTRSDCKNTRIYGNFITCFDSDSFSILNVAEENSTWTPSTKVTGQINEVVASPHHNAITVKYQSTADKKETGVNFYIYKAGVVYKMNTHSTRSGIVSQTSDFNWVIANEDKIEIFDEDSLEKISEQKIRSNGHTQFTDVRVICQSEKCATVISTHHDILIGFDSQGTLNWKREESIANLIDVDMIDYPSDDVSVIYPYFVRRNIISSFISRIKFEVESLINEFGGSITPASDRFGLRKIIVFVTKIGRVIGMDTESGSILYALNLPSYTQDISSKGLQFYIQRPAKYSPLKALATILYTTDHQTTMSFHFSPIDGEIEKGSVKDNNFIIKQSQILIHSASENTKYLKPIIALDTNQKLHTIPANLKVDDIHNCYFLVGEENKITGYYADHKNGVAKKLWDHKFPNNKIYGIYGKHILEKVHSQGRVLPDRSVSYKYLNPNLVVVITTSEDSDESTSLTMYMVDAVSGSMVHSFWHKKSKGPIHVVHSENWLVYTLFNEKFRRIELNSIELYEGQIQSNLTAFSSFSSPPIKPIVVKQSYIFPSSIQAMTHTRTEKGITNKDLLIALPAGGILELPRFLVQPRLSQQHYVAQPDDEFAHLHSINYIPELPIPSEMIINYNQSVRRVHGIRSWPTKLESTCLILVYGNDLFFTRAMPSKTFDILKDDFDYMFITIVLVGLAAGAYLAKKFSAKKQLEAAWR